MGPLFETVLIVCPGAAMVLVVRHRGFDRWLGGVELDRNGENYA